MKKLLVVHVAWCLVFAALSPLAQAQEGRRMTKALSSSVLAQQTQPTASSGQMLAGAKSLVNANPVAKSFLRAQERGDLSSLAGSGVAAARTGTVGPQTAVFVEKIPNEIAERKNAEIRARQQARRAGQPRPYVPVPEGAPVKRGPVNPPMEAAIPQPGAVRDGQAPRSPETLAPNDVVFRTDHDITAAEAPTSGRSTVMEPTVINLNNAVFYTGNWYAAKSVNGGESFTYVNPYTFFPSVNAGFCCDQVTAYAPSQDMALWGLQYVDDGNSNTLRIARSIGSAGIANNSWVYYDFTPQLVGFSSGIWFDYPSFTVGENFLYVAANAFLTSDNSFAGNVVLRLSLANLAAGGAISFNYFSSNIGTERFTEGAGTTIYWAGFTTTTQMRIHRWEESSGNVMWDDVNLNAFAYLNGNGVAASPDGTNWAARADSRPTAAYVAGGVIGVMWTAKQDAAFPKPYAIHARFSQATRALISQAQIHHPAFAYMYPAASPNAAGNLAGTLQVGGAASGPFAYPGTQMWITDDVTGPANTVGQFFFVSAGDDGPNNNGWGDYFSVRPHKNNPNTWVSASHTLQGGGGGANAVPKYLWFGRERDLPQPCPPTATPISVGQTLGGTLSGSDCLLLNGSYYDTYSFSGAAGQQVSVSMSSTAFDTYLYLLDPNGTVIFEDNDGGPGSDSRIPPDSGSFTLPSNGTYTIRASSFSTGVNGNYTINLSPPPTPMAGLQYYPLPNPIRLLDTRNGQPACDAPGVPLSGGATRTEPARTVCSGIPASAQVVVGNATVVNSEAGAGSGFITLYPSGAAQPTVSNLNYVAGQVVPNAFTVGLGSGDGAFNIFASSATHFIVDVTGYYAPPAAGGLFYHPLPNPVRLLDTRSGQPACDAPGTPLASGASRIEAARTVCSGIPSSAQVVVGNATVVNTEPGATGGFITLYPSGAGLPTVSNLNYVPNQVVPNAFTVGLGGGDGAFNIFASSSTHFIVDVTGYYSNQATDVNGAGLLFSPLASPVRLLDTRSGQPACAAPGVPLTGGATRTEAARAACSGVPSSAQVIVGNATVVNTVAGAGSGFITLYPSGAAQPTVSNLNYVAGQVVPNAFTVGLGGGDGAFNIFASSSTHFIVDLAGYFAP